MHDSLERPETDARRWQVLAGLLIACSALLHVAYLARASCPIDLAPDEAHYWDWSRHLDWSYYSKGPLVAWLIRGGTMLFGDMSQQLFGNQMLAVRLPAVFCGTLCLVGIYLLTLRIYGRHRVAFLAVACVLTLPMIVAQSSLMTIDAPYVCLWCWALLAGHQAYFRGARWAWPVAGLLVGVGILAKYTMVLWIPSFALFLWTERDRRHLVFRSGFWVLTAVAFVCALPILIWNAQHDWVTFRHVGGQAGLNESRGIHWLGPLSFIGQQCATFMVFWFAAWLCAMIAYRPWKDRDPQRQFLWWMSAPMFANFLVFSLKNGGGQANWPVTAYVSGLILAIPWLGEQFRTPVAWRRRLAWGGLAASCVIGVFLIVLMHFAVKARPVLSPVSAALFPKEPFPLRRIDLTTRLRGWRFLATKVDRLREQLRLQGEEPILMSSTWRFPGELAFYCEGHPQVYSVGRAVGERWSQYDCWRPNPLCDREQFQGRTVIMVGVGPGIALHEAFDEVVSCEDLIYREKHEPITSWNITVFRGFRGFDKISNAPY